jgi:radical SAM superfamily enzyme YgiQ (UPF0313 family)
MCLNEINVWEGDNMKYIGTVYRPPSEAYSLIIQVTVGCSHNKCTFCSMYKDKEFKIRKLKDIIDDLKEASPKDILRKDIEELRELKNLGLGIIYMGIESGCDEILNDINKGVSAKEIIKAGIRVKQSNIKLSTTLISGLGGKEKWKEHAVESARIVSEINPDYLGLLTLMIAEDTIMYDKEKNGEIQLLSPKEIMFETREFIKNINVEKCIFRSNHASNYITLSGELNRDKQKLLNQLNKIIETDYGYKSELLRGL